MKLGSGELIHVESWIGGRLPLVFSWRGRRHVVRHVEPFRGGISPRNRGTLGQHFYSLRTSSGLRCVLLHDSRLGTWSVKQVMTRMEGGRNARRDALV